MIITAQRADWVKQLLALVPQLPDSFMSRFFRVHATLEVHRASEELRASIEDLESLFPGSVHLRTYRALVEYHMRGKDIQIADCTGETYHCFSRF